MTNPIQRFKKNNKPLIFAHRGLVTSHQENTLSAVSAAMNSGICDGTEIDVFLTKDNQLVLFHDEDFKRLTGDDHCIYDMTLPELQALTINRNLETEGGLIKSPQEERRIKESDQAKTLLQQEIITIYCLILILDYYFQGKNWHCRSFLGLTDGIVIARLYFLLSRCSAPQQISHVINIFFTTCRNACPDWVALLAFLFQAFMYPFVLQCNKLGMTVQTT